MQAAQDLQIDARVSRTQFQYILQDADAAELAEWTPKLVQKLGQLPELTDVASDQQVNGLQLNVDVDREKASRLNVLTQAIDDTLYDAFGQRQVSIIFTQLNQFRVILEVEPNFRESPDLLDKIYVKSSSGQPVPLSAFATMHVSTTPLSIPHQGQFPAATISFNLQSGSSLSHAIPAIQKAERKEGLSAEESIYQACLLRFRPIMMTTAAALLGALPLAIESGTGSELRRPLGISIVGGLLLSQFLTLYTTPVIYLYLDRFGAWVEERRNRGRIAQSELPLGPSHEREPEFVGADGSNGHRGF